MDTVTIIGTVAACLTTSALLPQVVKAHTSRSAGDLSLAMFVLSSLGLLSWTVYGVITHSLPVIAANVITLFFSLYLIFLKLKFG